MKQLNNEETIPYKSYGVPTAIAIVVILCVSVSVYSISQQKPKPSISSDTANVHIELPFETESEQDALPTNTENHSQQNQPQVMTRQNPVEPQEPKAEVYTRTSKTYSSPNHTTQVAELSRNTQYDELVDTNLKARKEKERKEQLQKQKQQQSYLKKSKVKPTAYKKYKINNYLNIKTGTHSVPTAVSKYDDIISYWANYYALNANLVKAIISQESSGNTNNSSGTGWGLMQIENTVLSEFKSFGKTMFGEEWTSEDRLDPNKNVAFGCYRLRQNLEHYNGDYLKAIQAYNFSHFSLDKLIDAFGSDWYNHRDEIAYYNGHYERTGSTQYGDPNYIENVLKFLK